MSPWRRARRPCPCAAYDWIEGALTMMLSIPRKYRRSVLLIWIGYISGAVLTLALLCLFLIGFAPFETASTQKWEVTWGITALFSFILYVTVLLIVVVVSRRQEKQRPCLLTSRQFNPPVMISNSNDNPARTLAPRIATDWPRRLMTATEAACWEIHAQACCADHYGEAYTRWDVLRDWVYGFRQGW